MSDTIRTFIAIHLPQTVVAYLGEYQSSAASSLPEKAVRWVKPQNMHLTLRFLGDTAQSKIADVIGVMAHSAESHPPFDLSLSKTGYFPNARRPNVFWAVWREPLIRPKNSNKPLTPICNHSAGTQKNAVSRRT